MRPTPEKMIFNAIYDACIKEGIGSDKSKELAGWGLEQYRQNSYPGKPMDLVSSIITQAKKISKQEIKENKKKKKER